MIEVLALSLVLAVGFGAPMVAQDDTGVGQEIPREVRPGGSAAPRGPGLRSGPRGLTVTVVDYRGPVADATIRISNGSKSMEGLTNDQGMVLLDVRKRGRWQLEVEGEGYLPSKGIVPWPAVSALEVELRSVDEGTPKFAEGPSDDEVRAWLKKGGALLAEGKYGEARAEMQKTLRHLDRAGQAQVRASLARSYWLEGDRIKGLEELQEAIRLDPNAEGPQQVFSSLMEAVGRSSEVESRIAQLVEEPPKSIAPRVARQPWPEPVPRPAKAHGVGAQTLRFSETHGLADMKMVLQRLGYPEKDRAAQKSVDLSQESFDVFVPESYADREAGDDWGLFVWISPMERGGLRSEAVRELLAERRLIWVGANNSGNPRSYWQRVALALHAAENGQQLWDIDERRVFVSGYSGGGRTASMVAWLWPEVFRGAIFWMGTDFFEAVPVPYAPGGSWPARFSKPDKGQLRLVRKRSRFAFVTGDQDFNRSETLATFRMAEGMGFNGMTYLQVPGADHSYGVRVETLAQALSAIDP